MLSFTKNIEIGSDPELFVIDNKTGEVVGSERIITENDVEQLKVRGVVKDGIQVELNPNPSHCRELHAEKISMCLAALGNVVRKKNKDGGNFSISFKSAFHVSKREMDRLSKESKQFGCKPSYNTYNPDARVGVDGEKYQFRAAGGHLHIGNLPEAIYLSDEMVKARRIWDKHTKFKEVDYRARLTPLFDVVVGNTCVLIDRDPLQVERRKNYGRAGEYRLPKHGYEYRTLSNFWLHNYILFSFVSGLARIAVSILHASLTTDQNLEAELLDQIDFDVLQRAINTNDVELAMVNFKVLRRFINKHIPRQVTGKQYSLTKTSTGKFLRFAEDVQQRGLSEIFMEDPLTSWTSRNSYGFSGKGFGGETGWETFLQKNYTRKLTTRRK